MSDAADYAVAVCEARPETSDEELALDVAFVFLRPYQVFRLWVRMLIYHYWR